MASVSKTAGASFAEYFEVFSENNPVIPDKWCLDTDKLGAGVDKAVKYMKTYSCGFLPCLSTAARRIKSSRVNWGSNNVISPEDAKSFGRIFFPESASGKVYAASDWG